MQEEKKKGPIQSGSILEQTGYTYPTPNIGKNTCQQTNWKLSFHALSTVAVYV